MDVHRLAVQSLQQFRPVILQVGLGGIQHLPHRPAEVHRRGPGCPQQFAVDLQWVGWSAYEALNVEFNEKELGIDPIYSVKNYSNTLTFRFGGQYRACDWLTARMGMYVDESPVSSDYLNPETPSMTKVSYTAGLSFRPRKYVSIDVAYCYVSSADPERTGSYPIYSYQDNTKLESIFSGNYKLHAHVLSFGVGFNF